MCMMQNDLKLDCWTGLSVRTKEKESITMDLEASFRLEEAKGGRKGEMAWKLSAELAESFKTLTGLFEHLTIKDNSSGWSQGRGH